MLKATEHGASAFADVGDELDRHGRHDGHGHFSGDSVQQVLRTDVGVMINHRIAEVDGVALGRW